MGLTTLLDNAPEVNGGNGGNGEAAGVHLAKQFRSWDTRVNVHFSSAVDDALHLLRYAAQVGISIDETSRDSILCAAKADASEVDADVWANLIAALTTLAAQTRPITADTLRTSSDDQAKPAIASLRRWTLILALPIILLSGFGFVTAWLSSTIRDDIKTANELAVKLRSELGTSDAPSAGTPEHPSIPKGLNEADVIADLQLYASTIRAADARTRQLNFFVLNSQWDPFGDLPSGGRDAQARGRFKSASELPKSLSNLPKTFEDLTGTYQDVRSFGQNVVDLVSVSYGAITYCVLPILYALLGTCAFLLRRFEQELKTRTFAPSSRANWAHFLVAGIGGAVVGLFNFSITQQGTSFSPLAIAFLVGYGVDVFFSFLEGLMQSFTRGKEAPAA